MTTVLELLNVTIKSMSIENKIYNFDIEKDTSIIMKLTDFDIYKAVFANNDDKHLYRIDLSIRSRKKANLPFSFNIDVGSIVKTNTDDLDIENSLLNFNAVAMLYQICREKLATLNATIEVPIIRLPIIKLMENEKEIKEFNRKDA